MNLPFSRYGRNRLDQLSGSLEARVRRFDTDVDRLGRTPHGALELDMRLRGV